VVAAFKRKDPQTAEEEELVENSFDVLCSSLMLPEFKEHFRKGEGLELMVIMIKEKKFVRRRALKVLDFALNGNPVNCERFVEILGLKTLFSAFMKRCKGKASEEMEDEEHVVTAISHLLKGLQGESFKRALHKFVEDDHAKVDRLVELHIKYNLKVQGATITGMGNDEEDAANAAYLARLDSGLMVLQLTDFIIAMIFVKGRSSARERVQMLLEQRDIPMSRLCDTLQEYMENFDNEEKKVEGTQGTIELLKGLIERMREMA